MDQERPAGRSGKKKQREAKMRMFAAIVLATVVATPALAIDIVSGSGNVIKNGAGLNVVNGDPCSGRLNAACLDREGDRGRISPSEFTPAVEQASDPVVPDDNYPENGCDGRQCDK